MKELKKTELNLVPDTENLSPDYYCTWQSQLYVSCDGKPHGQRDHMTEYDLFGTGDFDSDTAKGIGWATHMYKEARKDLYFIMDDSWDVPFGADPYNGNWYGSLMLSRDKFPEAYGVEKGEPFSDELPLDLELGEAAMKRLADRFSRLGWKGLGGWVCVGQAQNARLKYDDKGEVYKADISNEEYWSKRLKHAYNAGWRYWKMDWGRDSGSFAVRKLVTDLAHELAPDMWIENAIVPEVIPYSDTFRSYDAFTLMAIPLTLVRLSEMLMYETEAGYKGLINCEDEPYIAAALGCVLGVMRHEMRGAFPDGKPDCSFPALHRNFKTKTVEVLRTVRWHRMAPAFAVSAKETYVDKELLRETWRVVDRPSEIEFWWKYNDGDLIEKFAPARISRRIPLAEVTPDERGYVPYVISSLNPNGRASVATLGRTEDREYFTPLCDITQDVGDADTVGVFGYYKALTLKSTAVKEDSKIYMQDLADDSAYDVTDKCKVENGSLTLCGELISKLGTLKNTDGDTSEPGVVVKIV